MVGKKPPTKTLSVSVRRWATRTSLLFLGIELISLWYARERYPVSQCFHDGAGRVMSV